MEGLCGNCNEEPDDDLKKPNGQVYDHFLNTTNVRIRAMMILIYW